MIHFLVLTILLIVSAYFAFRSLTDLKVPDEINKLLRRTTDRGEKLWGIILFLGKKTVHYTSFVSQASSSKEENSSVSGRKSLGTNE